MILKIQVEKLSTMSQSFSSHFKMIEANTNYKGKNKTIFSLFFKHTLWRINSKNPHIFWWSLQASNYNYRHKSLEFQIDFFSKLKIQSIDIIVYKREREIKPDSRLYLLPRISQDNFQVFTHLVEKKKKKKVKFLQDLKNRCINSNVKSF